MDARRDRGGLVLAVRAWAEYAHLPVLVCDRFPCPPEPAELGGMPYIQAMDGFPTGCALPATSWSCPPALNPQEQQAAPRDLVAETLERSVGARLISVATLAPAASARGQPTCVP